MNDHKIKNLRKVVEETLAKYHATRNSDILLTLTIWHQYYQNELVFKDNKWYVSFDALQYIPREDHIGRVRRKIQEEGKYPPTNIEVAKKRGFEEEEWRKAMGSNPEMRKAY